MLIIFSIYDRIELLPYFLKYYSNIGATHFACGLFNGEENPLFKEIKAFGSKYNLQIRTYVKCNREQFGAGNARVGLNKIRKEFACDFGWYCIADLDEFHYFKGKTIQETIKEAESLGYDAVHGKFFDRIGPNGEYSNIEGMLDENFPLVCDLTRVAGLCCDKIALAKHYVGLRDGHHSAKAKVWYNAAEVHHFKWAKGIDKVLADRFYRATAQSLPCARRQLPFLLRLVENSIDISNRRLNVRKASKIGV